MLPTVDTKNARSVAAFIRQKFGTLFPHAPVTLLDRVIPDVVDMFEGRHPDLAAIDIRYHDLEHTLQATLCMALLIEGYQSTSPANPLSARQFELGISAVMLHDVGYLKTKSDRVGTGAKYTFCHVLRSCAWAASYLPSLGVDEGEVSGVLGAISCTGHTKEIGRLHFRDEVERFLGCALATADFIGQMAAPDYPDELDILFEEFCESDNFTQVPLERRVFRSAADLKAKTPAFWRKLVLPKLDGDFQGVYRFLATPAPHGVNAYVEAVVRNIAIIESRTAALVSAGS